MDSLLVILFALVLVVGGLLLAFISASKPGKKHLDVDRYRTKWMSIEQSVVEGNEASYHMAILNADKLLDQALKERGFRGNVMGERMKSAEKSWSNASHTWSAHKLRNRVAHESDVSVSYAIVRRTLVAFKKSLKDIEAI